MQELGSMKRILITLFFIVLFVCPTIAFSQVRHPLTFDDMIGGGGMSSIPTGPTAYGS
jgi:hypothetical protein